MYRITTRSDIELINMETEIANTITSTTTIKCRPQTNVHHTILPYECRQRIKPHNATTTQDNMERNTLELETTNTNAIATPQITNPTAELDSKPHMLY